MSSKYITVVETDSLVIRFSGDSGDGMQLSGLLLSDTATLAGNGVCTFPDFPAEIRAPQGTVVGVSGYQVHIGSRRVTSPGDACDILIAMNPAALKANARWLKFGSTVIVDSDTFNERWLTRAEFSTNNPIAELGITGVTVIELPITTLTHEGLKNSGLDAKNILRCKNIFALGAVYFLINLPLHYTQRYFAKRFAGKPKIAEANARALQAGYIHATSNPAFRTTYSVAPAKDMPKGTYRMVNGNTALAWGLIAASEKSNLPLFCGSYPITPATEIFMELAKCKELGVTTLQVEDEIAGICTAIGASYAGNLAVTTTSGPGLSLKSEAIGLAVMTELPLVIVNVQRGGPSTGLPTKTEQSDLYQSLYGRNGECPLVVIAASTPSSCFQYAFTAARIALEHMTPVILLSDGFLANSSEPWLIPSMEDFPEIMAPVVPEGEMGYKPYSRDAERLARRWAIPGRKGLEHRVGGLEKDYTEGTVSYDPLNHQRMVEVRAEKVARVQQFIPLQEVVGMSQGDLLVVGWGGTYGRTLTAVEELQREGYRISLCHITFINPLPANIHDIFKSFHRIVVCELNMGQMANYLRMNHQEFTYLQHNKVQGLPFTVTELREKFTSILNGDERSLNG